jgi:hypothetical protein
MAVSEKMVERGARGIVTSLSDADGGPSFDNLTRQGKDQALNTARACLTAALSDGVVVPREPTPAMIDAASSASYELHDKLLKAAAPEEPVRLIFDTARTIVEYRAMIDAAAPPSPSADGGE